MPKGSAPKRVKVEPGPADQPAEVHHLPGAGPPHQGAASSMTRGVPVERVDVYFSGGDSLRGGRQSQRPMFKDDLTSIPSQSTRRSRLIGQATRGQLRPIVPSPVGACRSHSKGRLLGDRQSATPARRGQRGDGRDGPFRASSSSKVLDARTGRPIRRSTFRSRSLRSDNRENPRPVYARRVSSIRAQVFQSNEGRFKLGELVVRMSLQVMVSADGYEHRVTEPVVVADSGRGPSRNSGSSQLDPAGPSGHIAGGSSMPRENPSRATELRLFAARDRDPNQLRASPSTGP